MAVNKKVHSRGVSWEMITTVNGRDVRRRFPTKKQALDAQAALRHTANDGTYIASDRSGIRFADYAEIWLSGLQVRPSTRAQYACNLRHHVVPAFGTTRLDRIDRQQVKAFVGRLADSELAPSTTRGIVNLLRTVLRSAVDDGRLHRSPCVRITLPELPPKKLAVFSNEQTAALIAAVRPKDRALLLLALGTGLRQGELLGVTEDALDLDNATLSVERQLMSPAGSGMPYLSTFLKTKASRRVLPLPRFAVEALREHLEVYGVGEDGLLFTNPQGKGWRRGSINESVWKPLLQRAGLPHGYGMHALRHTYASSLIAQNLHAKVIQERMGHASIVETMDTYGHLLPRAHAETAAALDHHYEQLTARRPHLRAV